MITQHAWMFLSSFEKLRTKLQMTDIVNMAHLGARAFEEIGGEVVQTTSFVMRKSHIAEYRGIYCRLIEPTTQKGKEGMFFLGENRYIAQQDNFSQIPGSPVVYWLSKKFASIFSENKSIRNLGRVTLGMRTGNNERFLRLWHEIPATKFFYEATSKADAKRSRAKWFPYNKGGEYRKWYGNTESVVNWENDGFEIKELTRRTYPQLGDNLGWKITSEDKYFTRGIAWSRISSTNFGVRLCKNNLIFDTNAPMFFPDNEEWLEYIAGFMCSRIAQVILSTLNPTLTFQVVDVGNLPVRLDEAPKESVESIVQSSFMNEKTDWDSFETSWDFTRHPLVQGAATVAEAYAAWETECDARFNQLKSNEEELNRIFIDLYGLQDELTPEVEDKDITVRKADLSRDIRSFISYAVGCMFGRYSLNQDGLMFAGGNMKDIFAYYGGTFADTANIRLDGKYAFGELGTPFYYLPVEGKEPPVCWKVDADNVIPITDEEYFADDIVTRFAEFVKAVYGEETLEENLEFIAGVLGKKSFSSREAIRNYFLKDFFKDHCKIYQKRPIYWLFDSGKQNGFKCLIYMHRYNKDTLNLIRSEYLHKKQNAVENALKNAEYIIQSSASAVERAKATKDRDRYVKQLNEMRIYYQALSHLALQKIEIDLDDGVKHNYQLFQNIEVIVDGGKKQKVNLLAKI